MREPTEKGLEVKNSFGAFKAYIIDMGRQLEEIEAKINVFERNNQFDSLVQNIDEEMSGLDQDWEFVQRFYHDMCGILDYNGYK